MNEYAGMPASSTDSRLLDVAVHHFGRLGLEGASTRAIARDAETLMSSITYHFGGKKGLYLAAADHITTRIEAWISPTLDRADALCDRDADNGSVRAAIHAIIGGMTELMLNDETAAISRFIVREQAEPTEAFARIYNGVMGPMLERLGSLLIRASGDRLTRIEARVRAMTIVGQALVFCVARATAMTGMGWTQYGTTESTLISRTIAANLDAILDQLQSGDAA
ncbi:MAG: CerR family C-terminal domain-containing protein [Novosphingobium sp.]